jgi:adenylate cyclase
VLGKAVAALQPSLVESILPTNGTGTARSGMAEDQASEVRTTPGRDVFISYASQDKGVAESVCRALESAGLACWIAPRDVVPGESFAGAIVHAIDATRVIVLVLSEHAADSQHVLREVERASSKRHPVIALRLDLTPLPADFEYFLNTSQWLDASTTGVRRALPKLVEAVRGAMAQASAAPGDSPARTVATAVRQRRRFGLIGSVALMLAIAAYLLLNRFHISKPGTTPSLATSVKQVSAPEVSEKSIAVLPFVDMSEKHDQEYFSDGLSEELIDHLAHIPELKVTARTSSFAFKGMNEDMRSIASRLGVANLLEGSVRRSGNEVRVTAQLIRASDGMHLWSQAYDREFKEIFKLQDEIAATVAGALRVAMGTRAASNPNRGINMDAYNLLLKGNFFLNRNNGGDFERAIGYYKQALELDPGYALPWAQMAFAYIQQAWFGEAPTLSVAAPARAAAHKALEVDHQEASGHAAQSMVSTVADYDWATALAECRNAQELDRSGKEGTWCGQWIAIIEAQRTGRPDTAVQRHQLDEAHNPLDTNLLFNLGWLQECAGDLAGAAATFLKLLQLDPSFVEANSMYAVTLMNMGRTTEAITAAGKEPNDGYRLGALAEIYWTSGDRTRSDAAMHALEQRSAQTGSYWIGSVHAWRGEADAAFKWFDRAYKLRDPQLLGLRLDPENRRLQGDPRYRQLLARLNMESQ